MADMDAAIPPFGAIVMQLINVNMPYDGLLDREALGGT